MGVGSLEFRVYTYIIHFIHYIYIYVCIHGPDVALSWSQVPKIMIIRCGPLGIRGKRESALSFGLFYCRGSY